MFLRTVRQLSVNYMALYPRKYNCSYPPLWEPQILYLKKISFWNFFSPIFSALKGVYISSHSQRSSKPTLMKLTAFVPS
jgi:hypothetical protein